MKYKKFKCKFVTYFIQFYKNEAIFGHNSSHLRVTFKMIDQLFLDEIMQIIFTFNTRED